MPIPSKSPLEIAADAAVERATAGLRRELSEAQREIAKLKGVDVAVVERLDKSSGQHRLTLGKVETTNADLLQASTHLAGEIESLRGDANAKLGFLYNEVEKLKHVPAQSTATAIAAIDTKATVDKGQHSARLRFWLTIIPVIATALATLIQAFK